MRAVLERVARTLVAGVVGAVKALALLAGGLVLGVVLMQAGLQWYATGTFMLLPGSAPVANRAPDIAVLDATPTETVAIRRAVASIRYRLPARAVTFAVVSEPACPQCGGEFVPALNLIQIDRPVVDQGGPLLEHAVAHEIGHWVDLHYLTDSQRARFKTLRHIPASLPWLANDSQWQDRPVEDFAEVFAILNLTTIDAPPETSYGPVRNPIAFERFLASAGVHFGQAPPILDWRAIVVQEFAFGRDMASNRTTRLLLVVITVMYTAYGAVPAMRNAWRRSS